VAENLIILFAKSPEAGRVKTRLASAVTLEVAVELHIAFARDMISRFRSFEDADFELHTDTRIDAWANTGVTRKLQISGDLGLRMIHALEGALRSGYRAAIIIGSDAPTLPLEHVRVLLSRRCDVALGPAEDGGFYAIAARRVHPAMFDHVSWSRPDTLLQTVRAIEASGLTVELGSPWFDVDEPRDLERLLEQPDLPPETARVLARLTASRQSTD
jgi:rSAM/selenodomain-associated transferase 1